MASDLGQMTSLYPLVVESLFMSSSLAVILIDWNHSFLERSLLRLILSYLPRWRYRNIRQDVYLCLFGVALAIMYTNSMKNFAINMENCRIAGASFVVLLSFWLQSKSTPENVSDKCIETTKIKVADKSVGESLVTRDQEVSVSTCCEAGIPQSILSLLPSCSEPQSEVKIEEEMGQDYVKEFRKKFDEEIVPEEKLVNAIKYLNTLRGGITAHRDFDKLMQAVDHIDRMSSRLDDSGFPQDYSFDELRHIMVEEKKYRPKEFQRVVEICLETSGFLPSPEEFEEIRHETKVELEEEVEETRQEMEETRQEMEETRQEMEEALEKSMKVVEETTQEVVESRQKYRSLKERLQQKDQALQQKDQALQQKDQALQQNQQALQQNQQALQQKDRMLQQERQLLQQERQRVRELEENPEGELKRCLCELEEMKEEIRRLSAKSNRAMCKICWVEEVQVSFSPCNHLISCEGCVPNLPQNKCPSCRETIQGTVKMILA